MQNNNESLNGLFPKEFRSGIEEIAIFLTISIFNEGFPAILNIIFKMDVVVDRQAKIFAELRDNERKSDN